MVSLKGSNLTRFAHCMDGYTVCDCAEWLCQDYGGLTEEAKDDCSKPQGVIRVEGVLMMQALAQVARSRLPYPFLLAYAKEKIKPRLRIQLVSDQAEWFCKDPPKGPKSLVKEVQERPITSPRSESDLSIEERPEDFIPNFVNVLPETVTTVTIAARGLGAFMSKAQPAAKAVLGRLGFAGAALSTLAVIGVGLFFSTEEAHAATPRSEENLSTTGGLLIYRGWQRPPTHHKEPLFSRIISSPFCAIFGGCSEAI